LDHILRVIHVLKHYPPNSLWCGGLENVVRYLRERVVIYARVFRRLHGVLDFGVQISRSFDAILSLQRLEGELPSERL
jgi:hypothetical protein